jgi:hypothetical protein
MQDRLRWRSRRILAALLALAGAGCGPRRPALHAVSGEVHFEGQPVAGAGVLFCPDGGRPAGAITDDAGRFQLRTWQDADGAIAGMHFVCVTKTVPAATKTESDYQETKNVLPSRYASPVTSPLRADVRPGGDNHFQFDLEP